MRRTLGTLALTACTVLGTASMASAQTAPCDSYSKTCVKGTKTTKPVVRPSRQNLPLTGADVTGLALAGGAAVAGGTMLVMTGRKRHNRTATA
jgi:LPXTG-motif cell wall-anchored protein